MKMSFSKFEFTKNWENRDDFPTIQTDEHQVRKDMQSLHDETKAAIHKLIEELEAPTGAGAIGATDTVLGDLTVQNLLNHFATELREHVDVDPGNITAKNVGLLRELAAKYGLTELDAPNVHDALEVLERWAKLQPETARGLSVDVEGGTLDDAVLALTQTRLSSFGGGLLITATFASTGKPASNVYFTGLPDVDAELCRTDGNGEFFAEVPPGEYTLCFVQMIGEKPLEDYTVVVEQRKVTRLDLTIEKSAGLAIFSTSGDYVVGEDAATMKLCAVGGGGSGAAADSNKTANHDALAAGGGGAGYVVEAELELSAYKGQSLRMVIGAGGAAAKCEAGNSRGIVSGSSGGTTSLGGPDGQLLIEAVGGEGGTAGYGTGDTGVLAEAFEAEGGAGNGTGVTAKFRKTSMTPRAEFDDTGWTGVRVFGMADNPLVSRGGSAAVACVDSSATNYPFHAQSESGVQPGEIQGYGDGGAGLAGSNRSINDFTSTMPGADGAVFIMFAEV